MTLRAFSAVFVVVAVSAGLIGTTGVVALDGDATPLFAELDRGTDPFDREATVTASPTAAKSASERTPIATILTAIHYPMAKRWTAGNRSDAFGHRQ